LGHALIYHFPEFYPYFSHDHFVYAGINHHNHNHLMSRYDGMDGIKTGYIRASGFNLVASAKRGSTRLIGVVFGGHSTLERDNRMALLLDQAFTQEESDKSSTRASNAPVNSAEGDADDNAGDDGYVGLPAKVAAIFPQQTRGTRAPTSATIDDSESSKTWGIQIGAYTDADVGQQALSALQHNLPQLADAVPMVQKVAYNNTTVYRARLTAIDQKAAEEACAHVARQGQPCQVVSP
jgi:D-alanyl-D-alanine carboxypeptidase